jgi:starch synthase
MYSLRYGTVPIVRATGGLADSVDDEAGFKFYEYSPAALAAAIGVALEAFQDRAGWMARMRHGMADDFSWDASAAKYQDLYRSL